MLLGGHTLAAENEQQPPKSLEVSKWAFTHDMSGAHSLDHSLSDIDASSEVPRLRSDKPRLWPEGAHSLHLTTYITFSSLAYPSSANRLAFRITIVSRGTIQYSSRSGQHRLCTQKPSERSKASV